MISINRIFASCAALALCVAAHAASLNVGYCFGKISDTGVSKVGKATISAAVTLPGEMLEQYAGAVVTGVRVGLVTAEGVSNLTGWVRSELDTPDLDAASATAMAGWNEIPLSGGIPINGSPLAVGYSFDQEKSVKCISLVGEDIEGGKWIAKNGNWEKSSKTGVVSVELVIEGDNLPEKNLSFLSVKPRKLPVAYGEPIEIDYTVINTSNSPVNGFDLAFTFNGGAPDAQYHDVTLQYGESYSSVFSIESSLFKPDEAIRLNFTLNCIDEGLGALDTAEIMIGSYTESLPRRVLLEEFTTEKCPNCPRAINTIKQCESAGYGDSMTVVAHHVGYYEDWLTVEEDLAYLWFYDPLGLDGTYAPAVMLDRTVLPENSVPVNSIGYFEDFEPVLKEAVDVPAFMELSVTPSISDGTLTAVVNASRLPIWPVVSSEPRITVYVIEDGILHHDQAGIQSDTFTHSHVFRTCMTDIWGDVMEWDGDRSTMSFSCSLGEDWVTENLSVVAFINNYDRNNIDDCRVLNSAIMTADPAAVEEITETAETSVEYYTLTGLRVSEPRSGLLIRKTTHDDGSVSVSTVMAGKH